MHIDSQGHYPGVVFGSLDYWEGLLFILCTCARKKVLVPHQVLIHLQIPQAIYSLLLDCLCCFSFRGGVRSTDRSPLWGRQENRDKCGEGPTVEDIQTLGGVYPICTVVGVHWASNDVSDWWWLRCVALWWGETWEEGETEARWRKWNCFECSWEREGVGAVEAMHRIQFGQWIIEKIRMSTRGQEVCTASMKRFPSEMLPASCQGLQWPL